MKIMKKIKIVIIKIKNILLINCVIGIKNRVMIKYKIDN